MTKTRKIKEKSHIRIKLRILTNLRKFPMTFYELSKAIGCSYKAVKEALYYLEKFDVVEMVTLKTYDDEAEEDKKLWRIKSKRR